MVTVLANRAIARDSYRLELYCQEPVFFAAFRPGRFVLVAIPGAGELLLRRPFAVEAVDEKTRKFTLVYIVRGRGTAALSQVSPGRSLSVLGPLGNSFDVKDYQNIWLLAGREGIAPLRGIAQAHPERNYHSFVGFAKGSDVFDLSPIADYGPVTLCTDDGSSGYPGYAVDAAMEAFDREEEKPDLLLACGPGAMLAALDRALKVRNYPLPCFVSMETRMGCGTGVCLVCNCKIKAGDDWQYKRCCVDGPIFPIEEVLFDEIH